MAKQKSLGSALVIILVSAVVCMLLMVAAAVITGEWLYYIAGTLFAISGLAGIYVVRNLSQKMNAK